MAARGHLLVSLLLICSACESKPLKPSQEKVTQIEPEVRAEFEISSLVAPGGDQRVESAIILSSKVQDCLRQAVEQKVEIAVEIAGKVSANGEITSVQVTHANDSLRGCLIQQVKKTQVDPGPAGPFQVRIAHVNKEKPKAKTILLDKKEPKKFQ